MPLPLTLALDIAFRGRPIMCGIVGLFIKDKALEPELGHLLSGMLATMCDRGPGQCGFRGLRRARDGFVKITVQSATPDTAFAGSADSVGEAIGATAELDRKSTHAVLTVPAEQADAARAAIREDHPDVRDHGRRRRDRDLQGGRLSDRCRRAVSTSTAWPARTASATPGWRPNPR